MPVAVRALILKRFRSISTERIDFDNPTFLVGRNGSGKSNLADAFAFLADAMASPLQAVFDKKGVKAASNLVKHGVSFAEAATVFADPLAVYLDDGSGTGRMVVIGTSLRERVLYVVHVERGERDRIISTRSATAAERAVYETGGQT